MSHIVTWGQTSGRSWADMVEDSNSNSHDFDPLLDQSSKDGLNLSFSSALSVNNKTQAVVDPNKTFAEALKANSSKRPNEEQGHREFDKRAKTETSTLPSIPETTKEQPVEPVSETTSAEASSPPSSPIGTPILPSHVEEDDVRVENDQIDDQETPNSSDVSSDERPPSKFRYDDWSSGTNVYPKKSNSFSPKVVKKQRPRETDPMRLAQREKQIQIGKATKGYQKFMKRVQKYGRKPGDPQTPDKYQICSKRSWDGQISKWRRLLHQYDDYPSDDESTSQETEKEEPTNSNESAPTVEVAEQASLTTNTPITV